MDFELIDTHEASDAHAELVRRIAAYNAQKAAYKTAPNTVEGERLDVAHRLLLNGRREAAVWGEA